VDLVPGDLDALLELGLLGLKLLERGSLFLGRRAEGLESAFGALKLFGFESRSAGADHKIKRTCR
jgi:hypothetical protein